MLSLTLQHCLLVTWTCLTPGYLSDLLCTALNLYTLIIAAGCRLQASKNLLLKSLLTWHWVDQTGFRLIWTLLIFRIFLRLWLTFYWSIKTVSNTKCGWSEIEMQNFLLSQQLKSFVNPRSPIAGRFCSSIFRSHPLFSAAGNDCRSWMRCLNPDQNKQLSLTYGYEWGLMRHGSESWLQSQLRRVTPE